MINYHHQIRPLVKAVNAEVAVINSKLFHNKRLSDIEIEFYKNSLQTLLEMAQIVTKKPNKDEDKRDEDNN